MLPLRWLARNFSRPTDCRDDGGAADAAADATHHPAGGAALISHEALEEARTSAALAREAIVAHRIRRGAFIGQVEVRGQRQGVHRDHSIADAV